MTHGPVAPPDDGLIGIWDRERRFHDALARGIDAKTLKRQWRTVGLEAELMRMAGDLGGATVLDAGCGQGDLTLHLLRAGARVTALDVSSGMVELVARRAKSLDGAASRLTCVASPLERSGLPDAAFDLIVGRWVLHHVDLASAGPEMRRLLRPGGRAIFIETSGDNPLLGLARRRFAGRFGIPRFGTEDEHPLVRADLEGLSQVFPGVSVHYPEFVFFWLFDRQVLRYRWPRISCMTYELDRAVWRRMPRLRRYSYYSVIELLA